MKDPPPVSYVTLTIAAIVALRVIDLSVERPSRSVALRLLHTFVPFDSRVAVRRRSRLNGSQILEMFAWTVLAYFAFVAAGYSPGPVSARYYAIRWSFGL